MRRDTYKLFSAGRIGPLTLPNRLVRSATWDPAILGRRQMIEEVLDLYRQQALGGVGLIIAGGLPVYEERFLDKGGWVPCSYKDLRVEGVEQLVTVVHGVGTGCRVVAQLENGSLQAGPSERVSPFAGRPLRALSTAEIGQIVDSFVAAIVHMHEAGFDGVQLHAAHGGLLSTFLSPYTNRRRDAYGGSARNRVRIVADIVSRAREKVGRFPILIKMNGTDYVPGGVDVDLFPELAHEVQSAGVDAVEVSGGMWDCLLRSEEELGFRPVPAPESHTRIASPERQSYFLPYAERLNLDIPVILVGGNRDVERLEAIVRGGKVDFIAMCRPLLNEPDLPNRWREGRGRRTAACISCNACLYAMYVHPGKPEPGVVSCVYLQDRELYRQAQRWLAGWAKRYRPKQEGEELQ